MYLAQMTGGGMLLDTKLVNTSGNCSVLPGTVYFWLLSGHLDVGGVCVAHLFSFLCCDCLRPVSCVPNVSSFSGCPCVVLVFVLCLVYPMFPVSLVAPSVFSNIYLVQRFQKRKYKCDLLSKYAYLA